MFHMFDMSLLIKDRLNQRAKKGVSKGNFKNATNLLMRGLQYSEEYSHNVSSFRFHALTTSCSCQSFIASITQEVMLEKRKRRRENRREKENCKCCSFSVSFSVQSGGRSWMREEDIRVNAWLTVSVDHGCGSRG